MYTRLAVERAKPLNLKFICACNIQGSDFGNEAFFGQKYCKANKC